MEKVGSGDVLIRWDTGEEAKLGDVTIQGRKDSLDVVVEIPRWRLGLGIIWLGMQLIWPFRKRGEELEPTD